MRTASLAVALYAIAVGLHPAVSAGPQRPVLESGDPYRPPAIETANVPPVSPALWERLRTYQNIREADFRGWAPDGHGMLIQTRFGNTSQLHRVDQPGGRREQLTFFDEPAGGRFVPRSQQGELLVTMSRGGNEAYQIYYVRGADVIRLTDGTSRNLLGPVLDDGSRMIVASTARNGRDTDLYAADTRRPGSMKMILQTDGQYWRAVDWSPDRFTLAINHYVSINESYPALLDVLTGQKRMIPIPAEGKVSYGDMAFSHDGRYLYAACDANGEFRQLCRIDLSDFQYQWLTEEIPWNVEEIEVDRQSGLIAFTTNEGGLSSLYLLAPIGEAKRHVLFREGIGHVLRADSPYRLETPRGIIRSLDFSPDGRQLGFTLSVPNGPSEAYSLDVSSGKLTRWTQSETGGLDRSSFISPQAFEYPTFDGRMIPAWYFKPIGATDESPAPVLINIHGGPESQYRPYFSSFDQFLLNKMGIAVIRPNVRGSAGYGKTYLKLDNAEKREQSVRDIGALLDWIADQPELDESRVAVYGGSYGGYMVLASMTMFPERIAAGVDIVGLASFTTFLENTKAYRRDLRRAEYGDERDPRMRAIFERINPTSNVHKIRAPLLVAHGKNDPRVPFVVAQEVVAKVEQQGQKVWTIYAANEGHGFRKKENRDYLTAVIVTFLSRHLGSDER